MSMTTSKSRVLLAVSDGLGYDPSRVREMADEVLAMVPEPARRMLIDETTLVAERTEFNPPQLQALLTMLATPRWSESWGPDVTTDTAQRLTAAATLIRARMERDGVLAELRRAWRTIGQRHRYAPWVADARDWSEIVNRNITFPTHASGVWVGYEDVQPPVQGNSETGHQQIGNFALAPQIPAEISQAIANGAFYENQHLNDAIDTAIARRKCVNLIFLLSGITGAEGRVHSAWNHLEAMLDLLFVRRELPPRQVQIQAILDGRDAPAHGSLHLDNTEDGYLGELQRLLERYQAEESLVWVVGRSIAMDRDYREECAETNYELLTRGAGARADRFAEVRQMIEEFHQGGGVDADVPPIAVCWGDSPPSTISSGDVVINLNFRSDRQRATTASLSGAHEYLRRESEARGREWAMDWIDDDLNVHICAIAEYDPEFESRYGVEVAFPTKPHRANLLSAWDRFTEQGDTYLLAAESVKASHMGFFIRGRRETPTRTQVEHRWITPSAATSEGVSSDSDFYKVPAMKTHEVASRVVDAMRHDGHRLIICNFAAPDMIGHLLPKRYEEAISAYSSTCDALVRLSQVAAAHGYHMIATADHGNIEEDAPTHTSNPVLTTIIPAPGSVHIEPARAELDARLYDIPHTIAKLLGFDPEEVAMFLKSCGVDYDDQRFTGRSLVR